MSHQQLPLDVADRNHLIHPLTSYRRHEAIGPMVLESAKGMFLTDTKGREFLDAFAGLWCVNVGYGQESVVAAAKEQMDRLPYATGYFHFGNEPAIRLAEKLIVLAPSSLKRVFFTLGGSDAVDSAVRYITNYFNAIGKPNKKHIISLERGFHGSSSTGSGITGLPVFHNNFDLPLAHQHHIQPPYQYRAEGKNDDQAMIARSTSELEQKVNAIGADNVAAFFCEPVIGSGGVIVPPVGWLTAMRETCRELGILFVVDEVITGFGRTGKMFACEHEDIKPDLMTVAKGLTAGYAPMGAVMLSEEIYSGIADGADTNIPIGHGFTYSGHPVSAAVGLEVIRLYTEGGILKNAQEVAPQFLDGLEALENHPLVGESRGKGLLAALELVANKETKEKFPDDLGFADRVFEASQKNRIIFRAFADGNIGLAPALSCTSSEMDDLVSRVRKTLDDLLQDKDIRNAMSG